MIPLGYNDFIFYVTSQDNKDYKLQLEINKYLPSS